MLKQLLLAATVTGLTLAGPVFGHAKLRSSSPAAGARLQIAPKSLTLSFNEDVRLAVLTLSSGGKNIPLLLERGAQAAPQVTVKLPVLVIGKYQVAWSALSPDDGHVSKGTFSFEVVGAAGSGAAPAAPAAASAAPAVTAH